MEATIEATSLRRVGGAVRILARPDLPLDAGVPVAALGLDAPVRRFVAVRWHTPVAHRALVGYWHYGEWRQLGCLPLSPARLVRTLRRRHEWIELRSARRAHVYSRCGCVAEFHGEGTSGILYAVCQRHSRADWVGMALA